MSPIVPPLGCWGTPSGGVDADLEDEEVSHKGRRGWGPSEPLLQPSGPPHTEEDVGHLLSTLAVGLRLGTPRINTFSGDATLGKIKILFGQWYHEVQCVKDHYPESVVWESIIRSLKGTAVDMA